MKFAKLLAKSSTLRDFFNRWGQGSWVKDYQSRFGSVVVSDDGDEDYKHEPGKEEKKPRLSLFSFNIRYDNKVKNLLTIIDRITQNNYDVVALQEVTPWVVKNIQSQNHHRYEIAASAGEMLLVRRSLKPTLHTLHSMSLLTSGQFADIENRQREGRPFLFAHLPGLRLSVGTAHFWSIFEELDGKTWGSLKEKINAIQQCLTYMKVLYPGTKRVIIGGTNLIEDDIYMKLREQKALIKRGLWDLGAELGTPTWNWEKNKKQVPHMNEKHRPDRILTSWDAVGDTSTLEVHENGLSDHFAISCSLTV